MKLLERNKEAVSALNAAVEGMLFMSESDRPFDVFCWYRPQIKNVLKIPADSYQLDEFFETQKNNFEASPNGNTGEKLLEVIKQHIVFPQIIKTGTIEVHMYIIGWSKRNDVIGLHTICIET